MVLATLTYDRMRKVKKTHPKYLWWSERVYQLKTIAREVKFGMFTKTGFDVIKAAGLLKNTELDPINFKKLRQSAKKLVKQSRDKD